MTCIHPSRKLLRNSFGQFYPDHCAGWLAGSVGRDAAARHHSYWNFFYDVYCNFMTTDRCDDDVTRCISDMFGLVAVETVHQMRRWMSHKLDPTRYELAINHVPFL